MLVKTKTEFIQYEEDHEKKIDLFEKYDQEGRLILQQHFSNGEVYQEKLENYNKEGLLKFRRNIYGKGNDNNSERWDYKYDKRKKLIEIVHINCKKHKRITRYQYRENTKKYTTFFEDGEFDSAGAIIFDGHENPITRFKLNENNEWIRKTEISYNKNNLPIKEIESIGNGNDSIKEWGYDHKLRKTFLKFKKRNESDYTEFIYEYMEPETNIEIVRIYYKPSTKYIFEEYPRLNGRILQEQEIRKYNEFRQVIEIDYSTMQHFIGMGLPNDIKNYKRFFEYTFWDD
ncbi:MAG: hypothetical protein ACPGJS_02885 [Flammeovirgaceae bacterium]